MSEYLSLANKMQAELVTTPHPHRYPAIFAKEIFFGALSGRDCTKTTKRRYTDKEIDWAWALALEQMNNYPDINKYFSDDIKNRKCSEELEKAFKQTLTCVLKRSGRVRGSAGYTKFNNNYFQGLLADILVDALYSLFKAGIKVAMSVHDEVVCEVPESQNLNIKRKSNLFL